jgi:hypothetical protein
VRRTVNSKNGDLRFHINQVESIGVQIMDVLLLAEVYLMVRAASFIMITLVGRCWG